MADHSCAGCGESLFDGERFCPACGRQADSAVAVVTPPGATPVDVVSPRTEIGERPVPCPSCGRELAKIERFCPRCGAARPDTPAAQAPARRRGAEAAWKELASRLTEVTRGRYEIARELGRGGMAAVYLAHEIALDRKVAIKVMRPSFLLDDALVDRFLREARTMASFQHPNIVTVHAVEAANDLHYFVMQYIPGQSLAQVVREYGPLPLAAVQSVVFQAGAGLAHAHRAGVIHRDVKPANIMIDGAGNAIVTDFGIAKVMDLTTSATVGPMGTPLYMSPEQCSGHEALGPASDQYALGTVAFELIAGKPPFERDSPVALALAITKEPPPSLRSLAPDCPPEIEAAVLRMLAKRPVDRWPTLADAVSAIGGEALADDDPVRGFLAALARRDAKPVDSRSLTPRRSRIPTPPPADVAARRARLRVAAGIGILATAALFTVLAVNQMLSNRAQRVVTDTVLAPPAPPPTVPPDSTPPAPTGPDTAAVRAAEIASRPAGANLAIRAGDLARAEREVRRVLALAPDHPDGNRLLADVRRARERPSPPPPPPADTVRQVDTVLVLPPPPPPPPPPVVRMDTAPIRPPSREPAIRQMLTRYAAAINGRSLAQLKAIFPGMTSVQESRWRDLFGPDVRDLSASLRVTRIEEHGDVADATFILDLSFRPDRSEVQRFTITNEAAVRLEGGAWRITALRERGT